MSDSSDEDNDLPTNMFVDVNDDMFVGRKAEMEELEKQLTDNRMAAISGVGGVGKTTFSCLYAYKNRKKYKNGIFFIDASRLKTIPFHFAELANPEILGLTTTDDSIQTKMKLTSHWLRDNQDYLLIFDAADDPLILDEIFSESPNGVRYIPAKDTLQGHVVISSRCPDEVFQRFGMGPLICLEDLSIKETCEFLWKRVAGLGDIPEDELSVLKEIATDALPTRLPLFLEQSGSYIRAENISFTEYLSEMKKKREKNPIGTPAFGDNRQGLDERFSSNFDILENRSTNASLMLELASLCESRNIPLALFSCGAHLLQDTVGPLLSVAAPELDVATKDFIEYVMKYIDMSSMKDTNKIMHVFQAGDDVMRKLASFPWDTQLAILSKESPKITVHAVIQEQLRLRLKNNGKINQMMKVLGWVLYYLVSMDDIPLAKKQLFLAHADRCADFISVFGNLKYAKGVLLELYIRLKLKTAYIFAWYGLFKSTWYNLEEAEKALPKENADHLWVEYLAMKSRMYVWQLKGAASMEAAKQGLEYFERGLDPESNPEWSYQYAVLHKTCHHALIHQFRAFGADDSDVNLHFNESKRTFEAVLKNSTRECSVEYGALLMHQGEYYIYKSEKLKNKFEIHQELLQAKRWLCDACLCIKPTSQIGQICQVLIITVDDKLKFQSHQESISKLEKCRDNTEECLGKNHRFTAWVVEMIADTLEAQGQHDKCLLHLRDKLQRQKHIYDEGDGSLFFGETYHRLGRVLLKNSQKWEALQALEEAERHLQKTTEEDRLKEVRALLDKIRQPTSNKEE